MFDEDTSILTSGANILGTVRGIFSDYLSNRLLERRIDAEVARPFIVNDPSGVQYALGPGGQLFVRGQNALAGISGGAMSQLLIVGVVIVAGVVLFRALR